MKRFFLALAGFAFLVSCGNDDNGSDNCLSYTEAYVSSVEPMENADAAGFLFKVKFIAMNGCGNFDSFEEIIGDVTTVKLIAKYEGCACDTALSVKEAVYTFKPTAPGTYTLRFRNSEDTFITETVTLE